MIYSYVQTEYITLCIKRLAFIKNTKYGVFCVVRPDIIIQLTGELQAAQVYHVLIKK